MHFIGIICLLLILIIPAGYLDNRIGMPSVIGQIIIGIIVGPAVLNIIHFSSLLNTFSQIGVVILMFIGGLESDLKLLKKYLRPAIITAIIGVIFPVIMIGSSCLLFSFKPLESIFIGVIFSATSVSISIEVLRNYQALNTKEGATILGAAVADDIIGVILLSIMISIINNQEIKSGQSLINLAWIFMEQIIFWGFVYVMVKWFASYLMHLGENLLMISSTIIMAIIICLGMAWIANLVGLSGTVGAFFAGIAIAHTSYRKIVEIHVEPIGYTFFIPIFFVCIGLNMSFAHLSNSIVFSTTLTILVCLSKLLGCGLGALLNGFAIHSSYVVGSGMISRGEMGLITAQIGFSSNLFSATCYSNIILVIILSTIIAPLLLKHAIYHLPQSQEKNLSVKSVGKIP